MHFASSHTNICYLVTFGLSHAFFYIILLNRIYHLTSFLIGPFAIKECLNFVVESDDVAGKLSVLGRPTNLDGQMLTEMLSQRDLNPKQPKLPE